MAIKFYSDLIKRAFDTYEQCELEEKKYYAEQAEKQAAEEAKKQEQQNHIAELDNIKAYYENTRDAANKALEASRVANREYVTAVKAYFNKYGTLPEGHGNNDLRFMTSLFFN